VLRLQLQDFAAVSGNTINSFTEIADPIIQSTSVIKLTTLQQHYHHH
jgi:hypothetical protein